MREEVMFIRADGQIEVIGDPPIKLEQIGECRRERASSIVPFELGYRIAFILLRMVFGERGITAEWTRTWRRCSWFCLVYATGDVHWSPSRDRCVQWEREKLVAIRDR